MEIGVTVLSIAIQFVAAIIALRIAIASRRLSLLPLALAILLMGVRRSFSLYNRLAFERPLDVGAETIALTISTLMVVGLIGLRRWVIRDGSSANQGLSRMALAEARGIAAPRLAILLGLLAIIASCATGYFAFRTSRNAIHETIIQGHLGVAQVISWQAETLPPATSDRLTVEKISNLWERLDHPFPNTYLCVVRSDGTLLLHTSRDKIIGINVGDLPVETGRDDGPNTIRAMVATGEDWVGDFTSGQGESQVLACAYLPQLDSMVIIHTPAKKIDAAVRASALPWVGGLAFTIVLLIPLSLGILYWANAQRALELSESEERVRLLLNSTAEGIYGLDLAGNCTWCNPACLEMLGYESSDQVLGKNMHDLIHHTRPDGSPYPIEQCRIYEAFRIGKGTHVDDEVLWRADRSSFFAEYWAYPIRRDGELIGSVVTFLDITERKRMERKGQEMDAHLRQQQKLEAIGTLAGGVAHEINNPINGIMNYAQLINDRLDPDSPLHEFAEGIGRETKRVAKIVRNLLAFSRQEKESHSPASMADIVSDTLSLIRTIIRRDQITLEVDSPDDLPKIKCRSQQIQQVLMNLLINARDALNERYPEHDPDKIVSVTVRTFEKAGRQWVRTTVEDHGGGIPNEIRDRVFEPFFTTKDRTKGTGLGLSISHGIVHEHLGELRMESEPGQPTRFHIELPVDNGWSLGEAPKSGESTAGAA